MKKGYGVIEYFFWLVLITIIIITMLTLVGPHLQEWLCRTLLVACA